MDNLHVGVSKLPLVLFWYSKQTTYITERISESGRIYVRCIIPIHGQSMWHTVK